MRWWPWGNVDTLLQDGGLYKVEQIQGGERVLLRSPALSQRTTGGVWKRNLGWKYRYGVMGKRVQLCQKRGVGRVRSEGVQPPITCMDLVEGGWGVVERDSGNSSTPHKPKEQRRSRLKGHW